MSITRLDVVVRDHGQARFAMRHRRSPRESAAGYRCRRRRSGMLPRSCSESIRYCGVCVATAVADAGCAGSARTSATSGSCRSARSSRLFATSRWVNPACAAACDRRSARATAGRTTCCTRRSTMPGTVDSCLRSVDGEPPVRLDVAADDLDVDRRRQAEVQDLADDVGRR